MAEIPRWTVFEVALESQRDYDNPFWDVTPQVRFRAPSGAEQTVDAFWDGGRTWRVRFCPDEVGEWEWAAELSDPSDTGLHGRQGAFRCVPYTGENPLYERGPLQLSENRRYLMHADGTPWFWLADTAWNGVLRSKEQREDWQRYLQARREQGFTAIQFVSTQWRGCTRDPHGETAFTGTEGIYVNPRFFQRLDPRVAAINKQGLVAAPVLLWAFTENDPGQTLTETDAARLVRYLIARWGAHQVVWILGGDGDYRGERAERWRRVGNAAFGARHDRLATMHPCGQTWVGHEFRGQSWFDFVGYQSGHGDSREHLQWLVAGPPARGWRQDPPLPVINLEPNYETHPSYHSGRRFTDFEVRRAAYWSLLIAPAAGVTFGHNSIWVWSEEPEVPEGHSSIGAVRPWHEGLDTPGVRSMAIMRQFFDALPWWRLLPAPELLIQQPGEDNPHRFVAAARTEDGRLAVAYLPKGGKARLNLEAVDRPTPARWFNPCTSEWADAGTVVEATHTVTAPDNGDWVLCVGDVG